MIKDSESLGRQAEEIMKKAESKGLSTNYFFRTTFERYLVQLSMLYRLEDAIGSTAFEPIVDGKTNPLIGTYNRTSSAANNTVLTLAKIVQGFAGEDKDEAKGSKLASIMDEVNAIAKGVQE